MTTAFIEQSTATAANTVRRDAHANKPVLTAADLPALMANPQSRARAADLREFVKRWACFPQQRTAMIQQAPKHDRFRNRFTSKRRDLVRIAAVVHAMCDRDSEPIPEWVWEHRSTRAIGITDSVNPTTKWGREACSNAPEACAYHNVWFGQTAIENITVHGIRN